jgi:hypothetical protein
VPVQERIIDAVTARSQRFLAQPELAREGLVRLLGTLLLAAGGVFFFRQRALPVLAACAAAGALLLGLLWAGFHRLGLRPLGKFWPGSTQGLATAVLVFCLMPPGIPLPLAALLAALAVAVEAAEKRALVPLAASGVTAAWLLAWLWQSRSGAPFIAPFDYHVLDEPITLWVKFATAIDPVRTYAGQVAGPLGATSFGLVALATLLLSFSRAISWPAVIAFYAPIAVLCLVAQLPLHVYIVDGPALVFAALVGGESRRLPRTVAWRVATGVMGGLVAALMLAAGSGYQAFGLGVAVSTVLVSVFQFFGLAGAPGVVERPAVRRGEAGETPAQRVVARAPGRPSPLQVLALAAFMPAGLALVWRDGSLARSQRAALLVVGAVLYLSVVAASLTWLWLLRLPG